MTSLSFSINCCSTNFLSFSSVKSCSSREILRTLLVPISTWSFSNCSLNSSLLLIFFLIFSLVACEVSTSNRRYMGIVSNDRFLHLEYFSLVTGSLKPSDFFLINIRSFQSCLMLSTTPKAYWSLNNSDNYDSLAFLSICCISPSWLATKANV